MASKEFKLELARRMKELFEFARTEYPDLYYLAPSYMTFDSEDEIPDNVHVYMAMRTADLDYVSEDSDCLEDTEEENGKLEYAIRFDISRRGGEF